MNYVERPIDSWHQLHQFAEQHSELSGPTWIFRGQSDASRSLRSSLERAKDTYRLDASDMPEIEGGLIRKFKRQYYHYSVDSPLDQDYVEWMALMRHYGAPTRVLDWTYSFFVALFFALETSEQDAALFALNTKLLDEALGAKHPTIFASLNENRNIESLERFGAAFARRPPVPLVCAISPKRRNERLAVQQGLFLCPGDVTKTFEENLAAMLGDAPPKAALMKYVIPADKDLRQTILRRLHQMNVGNAALFPGLDGFAKSLHQFLVFPKAFMPPENVYSKILDGTLGTPIEKNRERECNGRDD